VDSKAEYSASFSTRSQKLKQTKPVPFDWVQVKNPWRQSGRNKSDWAKVVTVMRWYAQDEVNQEDSEQNAVDGMMKGDDSKGKVR